MLTVDEHFSNKSGLILKPTGNEILNYTLEKENKKDGGGYELIRFMDSKNVWGLLTPTNEADGKRVPRPRSRFYDQLNFGHEYVGIE
jgi:hypothetical protein